MSVAPVKVHPVRVPTIIYIDGFNFYYGAVKGGPHKWLNLQRFFTLLRPHDDIRQIHYFTAMTIGPTLPNQKVYLRALETCPLVNTILGNYKAKTVTCTIPACTYAGDRRIHTVEEKRTDVNIALQMLEDAYEHRCQRSILVSGDSDLVPAVIKVQALGNQVLVYIPARDPRRGAAVELRSVASDAKVLPLNLLRHSQFPNSVPDGAGGLLTKPAAW
jgi:6-hydroxy-3-succinoylpyridine 3-monooxygenase